jgi:hypothetical protein
MKHPDDYVDEHNALRTMLEKHQWAGDDIGSGYGMCPECGGIEPDSILPSVVTGHEKDCPLAALLKETE